MLDPVLNFSKATLLSGYASGTVTIVTAAGEGAEFPDPSTDGSFNLVWWNASDFGDPADDPLREIIRCTARSTDAFTIVRAQEGTSDNDHNVVGKTYKIALPFTKRTYDEIAIQYLSVNITGDYTASSRGNILADCGSGSLTITLPDPSGLAGRIYTIKKIAGSNSQEVSIIPNGSETIDGETSIEIKKIYTAVKLVTDGANFFLI